MLAIVLINATLRWVTLVTGVSDGGNVGVTVDGLRHTSALADVRLFCDSCCSGADYIGTDGETLACRTHAMAERAAVRPLTGARMRTLIAGRVGNSHAAMTARSASLARLVESQRVAVARLPRKAA